MKKWKSTGLYGIYSRMKVRNKIICSMYLVLLPILIISSTFVLYYNYQRAEQENRQLYQKLTMSVCNDISYLQKDVLDIATYVAVNDEMHQILKKRANAYEDNNLFWYTDTSISFLQDILSIKSETIKTLIIYPENGLKPFYQSRDTSVHNMDMAQIKELEIYQKALEANGDVVWGRVDAYEKGLYEKCRNNKLVACRVLWDLSKKKKLGFLAIGTDIRTYEEICRRMLQGSKEGIVVLGKNGEEYVRVGTIDEEELSWIQKQKTGGERAFDEGNPVCLRRENSYICYQQNDVTGIGVCYFIPKAEWNAKMKESLILPVCIILLTLAGSYPLSMLISRALSRPTAELCSTMEQFRNGDFTVQARINSEDEIGQLAATFNRAVSDIKQLIDKNYVIALRERESELDALQAQINPHFLYNVLDSFYWEAVGGGHDEIAEDILALSKLFRLLLSKGKSEIPIRMEIELITCYLQIQNMRFSKRVTYDIDMEEGMLEKPIGKLTLQPFVENAVVHGLEGCKEGGHVQVTGCRKDGRLLFVIEDNGIGMEQEEADRILSGDTRKETRSFMSGYAIHNIKERLVLRYGEDFSLTITSSVGKGIRVCLDIPEETGEENDGSGKEPERVQKI